jgi:hypothetical protein
MQTLYKRELYGETTALKIETMGATAVAIANRWAVSWEPRVMSLLIKQQYLKALTQQTDTEKNILSEATGQTHLSSTEILAMHSVPMEPPLASQE